MAPATLLAGPAAIVDLDGPLLLLDDRADGLSFACVGAASAAEEAQGEAAEGLVVIEFFAQCR